MSTRSGKGGALQRGSDGALATSWRQGVERMSTDEVDAFDVKNKLGGIGAVRDPHPRLRELREECPVHAGSVSGAFGVVGPDNYLTPEDQQVSVFTWDEVEQGFRDPETLSNSYYTPFLRDVLGRTILEMDPPDHQRY